ncbi:unannotated protein [freshwater metagenome]|uniref:Unannotated protein n=1 Tax=freshwater metagenome TaxID=449393 RepID=A0A6J6QJG8_9ZZZZ
MSNHLPDTRERLVEATIGCLRRAASRKVSIADVSRESGMSRQTIYSHFADRDELVHAAVEEAALRLSREVAARAAAASGPTYAVIEAIVAFYRAASTDPVASLVVEVSTQAGAARGGVISEETLTLTRAFIEPLVRGDAEATERIDEIAETVLRWLLSLMAYRSAHTRDDDTLRRYLADNLGPALRLP